MHLTLCHTYARHDRACLANFCLSRTFLRPTKLSIACLLAQEGRLSSKDPQLSSNALKEEETECLREQRNDQKKREE